MSLGGGGNPAEGKYHLQGRMLPLVVLLGFVGLSAVLLGRQRLQWGDLARLFSSSPSAETMRLAHILREVRLPRVAAAILVGAGLSVSGATLQGVFMNPLVSPGLLGAISGASFGAALAIMASGSLWLVQLLTFVFGIMAVLLVLVLTRGRGQLNLVLGGMISGAMFQSLLSLLKVSANPFYQLPEIVHFAIGNLAMADRRTVVMMAPFLVGSVLAVCCAGRAINILSLGDDEASSLGVRVVPVRILLIGLATLASSLCVAMAGGLGWVGLVVPHLARRWAGANHRVLLPTAAVVGAIYLLIVDTAARVAFPTEVPTGLVTALVGIPFLALLIRRGGKEHR